MSIRHIVSPIFFFAAMSASVFAVEASPSGQLQVQAGYSSVESSEGAHWRLITPNSVVGLTAIEQTEAGAVVGVFRAGVNPVADDSSASFLQAREAYLNWRADVWSVYAGRLPPLEQVLLIDLTENQYSREGNGLAIADKIQPSENQAVRVDIASTDAFVVSTQWLMDGVGELSWRTGAVVRTPEGTASITIRRDSGQAVVFGNQLTLLLGDMSIAGALLYDNDDVLAWDVVAQANLQSMVGYLSYGGLGGQQGQWATGLKQAFSESVFGFSEISWFREDESWTWSTGLRMSF